MAKILLVEDDPLMIRMYQRKLASDGYDVGMAVNGEDGLVKLRSFRPDLVLLDIMMPKLNGLQVLERMKADPTISSIPVIILTNLGGSQEDIERGLELGAVAYLVKSAYRPDEVVARVKEVLAGYTRSKEVPGAALGAGAGKVVERTTSVFSPPAPTPPASPTPPPAPTPPSAPPAPTPPPASPAPPASPSSPAPPASPASPASPSSPTPPLPPSKPDDKK